MTPTEIETYIRQRYNAVGDNFFPQNEIFNYIYAAQMELAQEAFCIRSVYTTSSVASQRVYDFPSLTLSIMRVEYDGQRIYPNDFIDDDALTGNNPNETVTGVPQYYQVWGSELYLRPVPSTSSLTIKIYSYNIPDTVTTTSTLDVPSRYHLMLVDYALYCMFAKDKNFNMAQYHYDLWKKSKELASKTERLRMVGDTYRVVKDMDELWYDPRFI